jgi:adenine-specific DNA-methyltransferase
LKRFLSEVQDGRVPQTLWFYRDVGHTQEAKKEIVSIFSDLGRDIFVTPKPTRLLQHVLDLATSKDSLILDSFAGSGTTAHAVLAANARDGGNRRFIMVEGEDYADTLTAERVRRVINGYPFKGTQREELLREPLTFTKLRNAATLMQKVQGIENLDGAKFDRIDKTVKDGVLIVTGERDCAENAPGLGGEFTFCNLGPPLEMDRILDGSGLPAVEALAGLLWHTATAIPLEPGSIAAAPEVGEGVMKLGVHAERTYWLVYKPDREWLRSAEAALSLAKARAIAATAPGNHLVFAPARFVSRELLVKERLNVDYAPLPFALYRLETA